MLQAQSASATSKKAATRVAARAQPSTPSIATERKAMNRMNPVPNAGFNRCPAPPPPEERNRPPFRPEYGSRNRLRDLGLGPVRGEGRCQSGDHLRVGGEIGRASCRERV